MNEVFNNVTSVKGRMSFPGDKSISHRALLFSALADGNSKIINLSTSEDVLSTKNCLKHLGVEFVNRSNSVQVIGRGFANLIKPDADLYAGNSGTTARLLSGILAAQNFESVITGDISLSHRPMKRIIEPLNLMGAVIDHNNFKLPLSFKPSTGLKGIDYIMPVASAQVKSMIILAALHSDQITSIKEKLFTRDHTERILNLKTTESNGVKTIFVSKSDYPEPAIYFVPGDVSSASFFIVLALCSEDSELIIEGVSLNSTRIAFISILQSMGAQIELTDFNYFNNEPFGNIIVKSSRLHNINIPDGAIPNIIDEIPILAIAGLFAEGTFQISNAGELRVKESDRIISIVNNLKLAGLEINESEDGFSFEGMQKIEGYYNFDSYNDHRIAMTFSILSCLLKQGSGIENFECVKISNPAFINQLKSIV